MKLPFKNLFLVLLWSLLLFSCLGSGPKFMKQSGSADQILNINGSEDEDGIISGAFKSSSSVTQVLNGSGDLDGASVSFPPGSLAIDTSISIQAGSSMASSLTSSELGISSVSLSSSSNTMVLSSSVGTDAASAMALALPLSSAGLSLTEDTLAKLVVIYKINRVADGKLYLGVIPRSELTVNNNKVTFPAKNFGAFQLVTASSLIEASKEVAVEGAIMTKAIEKKLEPIVWTVGKPTFSSSSRAAKFPFGVRGFSSKIRRCSIAVYESKTLAPLKVDTKVDFTSAAMESQDFSYPAQKDTEYKTWAHSSCEDMQGRFSQSPWSDGVTLTAKAAVSAATESVPMPVVAGSEVISTITMRVLVAPGGASIGGYYVSARPSSDGNADCTVKYGSEPQFYLSSAIATTTGIEIRPLQLAGTSYSIAICAHDPSKAKTSASYLLTMATLGMYATALCDTANTDLNTGTCLVLSGGTHAIANGSVISGLGNLTISVADGINTAIGDSITIDMGGTVSITIGTGIRANLRLLRANSLSISAAFNGIRADALGAAGGVASSGNGSQPSGIGVTGYGTGHSGGGGGGGHGGIGSDGAGAAAGGSSYGDANAPITFGSGGGAAFGNGGAGGGAIRIIAENISMGGAASISANGEDGTSSTVGGGGGAGGSVWITALTSLTGTWNIYANGGVGAASTLGGKGAGGRIKVEAPGGSTFPSCSAVRGSTGTDSQLTNSDGTTQCP